MNRRKRFTSLDTYRFSDINIWDSCNCNNITAECLFRLHSRESERREYFCDLSFSFFPFIIKHNDILSLHDGSFIHPSDPEPSDKIIVAEIGNLHTERFVRIIFCRFYCFFYKVENREDVAMFLGFSEIFHIIKRIATFGTTVDDREICLCIRRSQRKKQIKQLIDHPHWPRGIFINFIDHNDRLESEF